MLKRHSSSVVLKIHDSGVEQLPDDVVELILERLPVKSLLRFKCVSNKWKSTIESKRFQEQQLIHRMRSRGPDVLSVSLYYHWENDQDIDAQTRVLGSSIFSRIRFPLPNSLICHGSCDGLLCLFCFYTLSFVVNPTTRWLQTFPLSNFQQLIIEKCYKQEFDFPNPKLGFGKDKLKGTYKPVWLYNSSAFGLDNVTTCEVFDFSSNAWRYVHPSSPYRINDFNYPVYLDGSLHWFTQSKEPEVLALDLHTETFQVICKTPFSSDLHIFSITMCILDNRLCVCENKFPTQVIWSLDYYSKTWNKLCSIDLTKTVSWFGEGPYTFPLSPIAILDEDKLLLQGHNCFQPIVILDLRTKSYDLLFSPQALEYPVSYFQSLFSN